MANSLADLEATIDPALRSPSASAPAVATSKPDESTAQHKAHGQRDGEQKPEEPLSSVDHLDPEPDLAQLSQQEENEPDQDVERTASGSKKRKRRPLPPGSAADFRRKEANRKAAERSRSRAAEKTQAILDAYAELSTEHDLLLAEINRLEEVSSEELAEVAKREQREREEREQREVEAQVEAAIATAQRAQRDANGTNNHDVGGSSGDGAGQGGGMDSEYHEGDSVAARERDERSILAALMEGGINIPGMGLDGYEGGVDDQWDDGEKDEDDEGAGRLGQLANVAAEPRSTAEHESKGPTDGDGNPNPAGAVAKDGGHEDRKSGKEPSSKPAGFAYIPHDALTATASLVAISLHADLEKAVRNEVASTRVAIARIEKQLVHIREDSSAFDAETLMAETEGDPATQVERDVLPAELLDGDEAVAEEVRGRAEKDAEDVQQKLAGLRVKLLDTQENKLDEEAKVAELVQELYKVGSELEGEERGKIMQVLKDVKGYIGNLVWVLEDEVNPDDILLGTSYSSPAIAPRRRGRPPRPSSLQQSSTPDDPSGGGGKGVSRAKRTVGSSGLGSLGPDIDEDNAMDAKADDPTPRTKKGKIKVGMSRRVVRGRRLEGDTSVIYVTDPTVIHHPSATAIGVGNGGSSDNSQAFNAFGEHAGHLGHGDDSAMTLEAAAGSGGDGDRLMAERAGEYIISSLEAANKANAEAADLNAEMMDLDSVFDTETLSPSHPTGQPATDTPYQETHVISSGSQHLPPDVRIIKVPDPAFQSSEWTESVLARLKSGGVGSCDICSRTETSVWRKLTLGGEEYRVCNACGLYYRKFGVIRPPSLWGDGESFKKRRVGKPSTSTLPEAGLLDETEIGNAGQTKKKRKPSSKDTNADTAKDSGQADYDNQTGATDGNGMDDGGDDDLALLIPALVSAQESGQGDNDNDMRLELSNSLLPHDERNDHHQQSGSAPRFELQPYHCESDTSAVGVANQVDSQSQWPSHSEYEHQSSEHLEQAGHPQSQAELEGDHHDPTGLMSIEDELGQFQGAGMDAVFAEIHRSL